MANIPSDHFVTSYQFTPKAYIDVYPAIDPTSPALSQAGKVVVITGASRGLGSQGFAKSFAQAGAKAIVLLARSASKLKEAEEEIKKVNPSVQILSISTDVSNEASVKAAFDKIKSTFGTVDVLINNAGIYGPEESITDVDANAWWETFQVNILGTFLVAQNFLKVLGSTKSGTIVTLTSAAALMVLPKSSAYVLTKLVGLQFSGFIKAEYPNVTAIGLHPGIIATDMTTEQFRPFANDTAELVGGTGVWLASGDKQWLGGRYVHANWDVEGLEARREEIERDGLLEMKLNAKLGIDQFKV